MPSGVWKHIAAACAAVALFAATCAEQADARGTAAATAATSCGHDLLASVKRSLSSANSTKLQQACHKAQSSLATVRFFQKPNHHWMRAPRFQKWWLVPDKQWRHTVRVARAQLRLHQRRLEDAVQEIQKLTFDPWLLSSFLCIHRFEGAWTSNTGNGYYGGLQMDRRFMSTYGPEFVRQWGTADNWPVWAQLEASKRAYMTRGFNPWPNTARACGLL